MSLENNSFPYFPNLHYFYFARTLYGWLLEGLSKGKRQQDKRSNSLKLKHNAIGKPTTFFPVGPGSGGETWPPGPTVRKLRGDALARPRVFFT